MFDTNMMSHHCLPSQKIALETPSEINQPFLLQEMELQNQSQGPPAHRLRYPKDPPKCAFQVPRLKRPMITLRGPGPAKALPGKLPEKTGVDMPSTYLHPEKSSWNPKMDIWKMIFLCQLGDFLVPS